MFVLAGIKTPTIYMVDMESNSIFMEYLESAVTVREYVEAIRRQAGAGETNLLTLAEKIGAVIGKAHQSNIIHGDLTTSNMLLTGSRDVAAENVNDQQSVSAVEVLKASTDKLNIVLIDFGLTALDGTPEDKGVDLYVLERALLSTHPNTEHVFEAILSSYRKHNPKGAGEVIKKLDEVRLRGRKRTMVG